MFFDWNAIFLFILNQSVVASYVILGVLLIRLLLKAAPKSFSYALWAVVLFRLVCPLSLESNASLIPVTANPISKEMLVAILPQGSMLLSNMGMDDSQQSAEPSAAGQMAQGTQSEEGTATAPVAPSVAGAHADQGAVLAQNEKAPATAQGNMMAGQMPDDASAPTQGLGSASTGGSEANFFAQSLSIARNLWLLGMVCLLLYSITSLLRLHAALANALPFADGAPMQDGSSQRTSTQYMKAKSAWSGGTDHQDIPPKGVQGKAIHHRNIPCEVYYSPEVETAFVLGVWRPKIYLPVQLSRTEMEYILLHEQTHIRRGDHIIKLIAYFVLCLHWFNPLVWIAFFLAGKDMELSCDERVIQTLGHSIKREYSASLLSLATGKRILGGAPLAFGEGDTKSRIQNVLRYQKPALWLSVVVGCLLAVSAVALLSTQKGEETPAVPAMQEIVAYLDAEALPEDTRELNLSLASLVVRNAVDALNAAGEAPTDGSAPYYVTGATITDIVPQSTGAATDRIAVGVNLLCYEITLSTTESIALPEGYQLTQSAAAAGEAEETEPLTLVCTPTEGARPYLFTFGGSYEGEGEWQTLGMQTYDDIARQYSGPAMLSYYGDCITAIANELLSDCMQDKVDFSLFAFAPAEGMTVEMTLPASTQQSWRIDLDHGGRSENIYIDYKAFAKREPTPGMVVAITAQTSSPLPPKWADGLNISLGTRNQVIPTLYGIYTDEAGEEYLFAYGAASGTNPLRDGTEYSYALYDLSEDFYFQEIARGDYGFYPGETVSTDGTPLQTVFDTINAYAKNTTVILSVAQDVAYYTADGTEIELPFSEEAVVYMNDRTVIRDFALLEAVDSKALYDDSQIAVEDFVLATQDDIPLYMQLIAQ